MVFEDLWSNERSLMVLEDLWCNGVDIYIILSMYHHKICLLSHSFKYFLSSFPKTCGVFFVLPNL